MPKSKLSRHIGGKSADEVAPLSAASRVSHNRHQNYKPLSDYIRDINPNVYHDLEHDIQVIIDNYPNNQVEEDKNIALYEAVVKGYSDIAQVLLNKGATITNNTIEIITYAVKNGNKDIVIQLLEKIPNSDRQVLDKTLLIEELEFTINFSNNMITSYTTIFDKLNQKLNIISPQQVQQVQQVQEGGAKISYKGRKYKIHIGKNGGRYILVGRNKTKIYV